MTLYLGISKKKKSAHHGLLNFSKQCNKSILINNNVILIPHNHLVSLNIFRRNEREKSLVKPRSCTRRYATKFQLTKKTVSLTKRIEMKRRRERTNKKKNKQDVNCQWMLLISCRLATLTSRTGASLVGLLVTLNHGTLLWTCAKYLCSVEQNHFIVSI